MSERESERAITRLRRQTPRCNADGARRRQQAPGADEGEGERVIHYLCRRVVYVLLSGTRLKSLLLLLALKCAMLFTV